MQEAKKGNYREALRYYEAAIAIGGDEAAVWSLHDRARILLIIGGKDNNEQAVDNLEKAVALLKSDPQISVSLAIASGRAGNYNRCADMYRIASTLDPKNHEVSLVGDLTGEPPVVAHRLHDTGLSFFQKGNFREALRYYDLAVAIGGERAAVWSLHDKGVALMRLGDYEEAEEIITRVKKLIPNVEIISHDIMEIYQAMAKEPNRFPAETCANIISRYPFLVYGKRNRLIDWETRDRFSDGNLINKLLVSKYDGLDDIYKVIFFDEEQLNFCILRHEGGDFRVIYNHQMEDARQYFNTDPLKYGSRDYKTPTGSRMPTFMEHIGFEKKHENTDVIITQKDGPFFGFSWYPSTASTADMRPNRNNIYAIIPDRIEYNLLVDIITQKSKTQPSFFYEEVLPKLFPKALNPQLNLNDAKIIDYLFDKKAIVRYLLSWEGPFSAIILDRIFNNNKNQPEAAVFSNWERVLSRFRSSERTHLKPLFDLLAGVIDNTGASFSLLQFKNRELPQLVEKLVVSLRQNPQPYLGKLRKIAALSRSHPCKKVELYNLDDNKFISI